MKISKQDQAAAILELRKIIKPGDTIYTILRHVSGSGMSRDISLLKLENGQPHHLTYTIAQALGYSLAKNTGSNAIKVSGGGMDMGFSVVYNLSRTLFPNGFGIEGKTAAGRKVRPTSKAHAAKLVQAGADFRGRNGDGGGWDNDGGYALNQRWL